ncbi:hypothetical protein GQ457_01G026180 [Hibiscus cannabinus]
MASARYNQVAAKSKWEEQAFFFDDALPNYGLEQFVYNRLRELGWFRFGRQPLRANYNWVLEFYANNAEGDDFSIVRGRRVPATAAIINELFGLPNDAPSFYQMLEAFEEEDYETIKNLLCLPNTQWNTTGRNPHSVSRQSLLPEAKLWNTFVKRNLLPTSHNQIVDRTRLLLINTIMTGFKVNAGEILSNELAALCKSDKGILAFPCLVSALCRRVNTPMFDTEKYQAEKTGWTRAVYMRKMNVADVAPLNMALPTPPASPVPEADARAEDSAPPSPAATAEQSHTPPPSPPIIPVFSHRTTTSPATTPAAPAEQPRGRTTETPLGSTPSNAQSPPAPAQSEEAGSLQYMLLRSQLQRIEARQLHFQNEVKVFQDTLTKFLLYQFPASATFFGQTSAPPTHPSTSAAAAAQPSTSAAAAHQSTNTSAKEGATKELHFSSDDENDVFDWQSPRDHLMTLGPSTSTPAPAIPILSAAPTPTTATAKDRPTPDSLTRKRGKSTAGRTIDQGSPSSPEEEAAEQRPAKRRHRYHIITAESDEDGSVGYKSIILFCLISCPSSKDLTAVLFINHTWKASHEAEQSKHFKECMIQRLCENSMVSCTEATQISKAQKASKQSIGPVFPAAADGRDYQQEGRNKVNIKDLKPKRIKDSLECKISQRSPALLKYLLFNDS